MKLYIIIINLLLSGISFAGSLEDLYGPGQEPTLDELKSFREREHEMILKKNPLIAKEAEIIAKKCHSESSKEGMRNWSDCQKEITEIKSDCIKCVMTLAKEIHQLETCSNKPFKHKDDFQKCVAIALERKNCDDIDGENEPEVKASCETTLLINRDKKFNIDNYQKDSSPLAIGTMIPCKTLDGDRISCNGIAYIPDPDVSKDGRNIIYEAKKALPAASKSSERIIKNIEESK